MANPNDKAGFFTDRIRIVMAGAIVVLTVGVVFLVIQNQDLRSQSIELLANEEDLQEEIQDLEARIVQMDTDLQNKDIELETKDKQVEKLNAELEDAKRKVYILSKGGRLNQEDVDKYKYQIDQMNYYVRKYQREIERLKAENAELTAKNEELQGEVELRDQQMRDLEQESRLYQTKLDAASILKAVEFQFTGVNNRGKEYPASQGTLRGASTQQLQICFRILENDVADLGQRPVYVTIQGPDGKIYSSFETGSGFFTHNGQEIPYSSRVVINYDRTAQNVCAKYASPAEGFLKGRHNVVVYSGGYKIGGSSFVIS